MEGGPSILGAVGVGIECDMEVLILIPKETYKTCNFMVGMSGSCDPPPPCDFIIQQSRESLETIDAPQIYGCSIYL